MYNGTLQASTVQILKVTLDPKDCDISSYYQLHSEACIKQTNEVMTPSPLNRRVTGLTRSELMPVPAPAGQDRFGRVLNKPSPTISFPQPSPLTPITIYVKLFI